MQHGTTIRAFLWAIWSSWFALMSGPPTVPLTIAAFYVENTTARIILAVTAVICLWAAAYAVWGKEREERHRVEADLIAARASNEHALAIERQTEEMRRQREQREREIDPAIRAFRE